MIGQKFGRWTVIAEGTTKTPKKWLCECECGTVREVRGTGLRAGESKSCGCLRKEKQLAAVQDLTGQRFGSWTVIERAENRDKHVYWKCQCDCGTIRDVIAFSLKNKTSVSCGCLHPTWNYNLIGQKFGLLTVIKQVNKPEKAWLCKCDCGEFKTATTTDLKSEKIKSCGCLKRSKNEEIVFNILKSKNINFKTEYTFNDLIGLNNHRLRFDFAIFLKNELYCLIEVQGELHYENRFTISNYNRVLERDKEKVTYCRENNIKLFVISHFENIQKQIEYIIQNMGGK